jgi:hypothetical protein
MLELVYRDIKLLVYKVDIVVSSLINV